MFKRMRPGGGANFERPGKMPKTARSGKIRKTPETGKSPKTSEPPETSKPPEPPKPANADFSNGLHRVVPPTLWARPDLSAIRHLSLSNNRLVAIPNAIGTLVGLRTLSFHNNLVATISPSISKLTNLQYLFASRNRLREIPAPAAALTGLRCVSLSNNLLDDRVLGVVRAWTGLRHLSLCENPGIRDVAAATTMPSLRGAIVDSEATVATLRRGGRDAAAGCKIRPVSKRVRDTNAALRRLVSSDRRVAW